MRLYHRTAAAAEILGSGFRDNEGHYLTDQLRRGVWFSDRPLDFGEGGPTVLAVECPDKAQIAEFEWVTPGQPFREWCLPAEMVNQWSKPVVFDHALAGCSADVIERAASACENAGQKSEAQRIRSYLPYLRKHGLLRQDGDPAQDKND